MAMCPPVSLPPSPSLARSWPIVGKEEDQPADGGLRSGPRWGGADRLAGDPVAGLCSNLRRVAAVVAGAVVLLFGPASGVSGPVAGFLVFVVVLVGSGVAVLLVSVLPPWLCALALLRAVGVPLAVTAYADRRRGGRGPWPGRGRLLAKRKISRRMVVFGPVPGRGGADRLAGDPVARPYSILRRVAAVVAGGGVLLFGPASGISGPVAPSGAGPGAGSPEAVPVFA